MKGWKTWLAAIGTGALGVYEIKAGNTEGGIMKILGALALVGIGHKVEKAADK